MRSFLSNLVRVVRTAKTARPARWAPHRANLRVEGLEDRLVPTTVSFSNSTLTINPSSFRQITLESAAAGQMLISDSFQGLLAQAKISAIKAVNINLAGADQVVIDDSNGMPFASGTAISLQGGGTNNSMTLRGSRSILGNETYVAGGLSSTPGEILMDNLTFNLHSALTSVADFIQITGTLDVQTSGTAVWLSNLNFGTQTLTGMGFGGGDNLTYANKPTVTLETFAFEADAFLNAASPATLESNFSVIMHGVGASTSILTTASGVTTDVTAQGKNQEVNVEANSSFVLIQGNSSSLVFLGHLLANGRYTTQGIQANVNVLNAQVLQMSDSGDSRPENVTVTDTTISGTGLFGNDAVKVFYGNLGFGNVGTVSIAAGAGANNYMVQGSHPGAAFTSHIQIFSDSSVLFDVQVNLDSHSQLNLLLTNEVPAVGRLFIHAPGGSVGDAISPTNHDDGTLFASFPGEPTSVVNYDGFPPQQVFQD